MRKVLLILLLGVFFISFTSALEKQGYDWDNVEQFTKDNSTSEYGKYEIRNSVLGLKWFQYGKVADIELKNNSDICGEDCFAEKEITLYEDGVLIDEVTFETKQQDGSWKYQPIRSYSFSYHGEIQDYKTVCVDDKLSTNGTMMQSCSRVKDGTHLGQIDYTEGAVVRAGTYILRLDGSKKPGRTVDWKIKTNGIWTNEWAVWGNISLGADAEVILNSPDDDEVIFSNPVIFNASANVTGGAFLVNMSLYTNESGVWEAKNTTNILINEDELIAYYTLDDNLSTTNVIDSLLLNNGTLIGGDDTENLSVAGKINLSLDFDGTNAVVIPDSSDFIFTNDSFSVSFWYKIGTMSTSQLLMSKSNMAISNEQGFAFRMSPTVTRASIITDGQSQKEISWAVATDDGNWHMFTFTFNGTEALLYIDNVERASDSSAAGNYSSTGDLIFANTSASGFWGGDEFEGELDEVGVWNSNLNQSQITELWNSGNGQRPIFTTVTSSTRTWERTITESTLWTVQACDSDGACGFALQNRTVGVDTSPPNITIFYPTGIIGTFSQGETVNLNYSISDDNLDTCWVSYNGTNTTIGNCSLNTTFTYQSEVDTITVYANDTLGNIANDTSMWTLLLVVINQTFNDTSFETAFNDFRIDISSSASSIILPKLIYEGIERVSTLTIINSTNFIMESSVINNQSVVGNNTFFWNITLDGTEFSSPVEQQNISEINFSICDISNNITYLSIDFQDELTLLPVNATIRASTFNYYVENILAQKTYTYSTPGNESSYDFCFDPSEVNITMDLSISYFGSIYPERTFGTTTTLSNVTTNVTLDLLDEDSGIYATFQFLDATTKVALSAVNVQIFDGTTLVIETTTGDGGIISEWLNPNILYEIIYSKTGYDSGSQSRRPVNTDTFVIEMVSDSAVSSPFIANGLITIFYPQLIDLLPNTIHNFGFFSREGEEEISLMSFQILDEDRNEIYSAQKSGDGNITQQAINVSQNRTLLGIYELNGTDGGYWKFERTYYVAIITNMNYSLEEWGKSLDDFFPAADRSTTTNFIWYILWFICMMAAFTYGYNGAYSSSSDISNNITTETRSNTSTGLLFAFIVTWIFAYFNMIPFPMAYPASWWGAEGVLWIEQYFLAVGFLIPLVYMMWGSISRYQRRGA